MQELRIFQYIFDELETPFLQSISAIVSALISYAAAPIQTALVLYIALTGILMMRGQGGQASSDVIGRMVKLAIVVWIATNGSVYTTWVQEFFLTVLPNDINKAVSNAGNGGATIDANTFDTVWKQAFEAGLRVWRLLDYWDLGEIMVIVLFWLSALIACIAAFAIWFLSHVILGLFIIIGPLVLGLVLFPATKAIFERWIGAMISCVILQVITVIMVTLTLRVEDMIVQKILNFRGVNQFAQMGTLLSGVTFFFFATVILFQLPGFATALAGGLHFHTGAVARGMATSGRLAGKATVATGKGAWTGGKALASGAVSGVTAVRRRIGPSTGGSLSRSSPPPAE